MYQLKEEAVTHTIFSKNSKPNYSFEKGKPVVMLGRKASDPGATQDSGVAERNVALSTSK